MWSFWVIFGHFGKRDIFSQRMGENEENMKCSDLMDFEVKN